MIATAKAVAHAKPDVFIPIGGVRATDPTDTTLVLCLQPGLTKTWGAVIGTKGVGQTAVTDTQQEFPLSDEETRILDEAKGRILLYHISGPMSFGAAKGMARRLASFDEYDVLVVDLSDVPQIDFTSTRALDDMLHDAWDSGREAYLVGCEQQVCDMLMKQGVVEKVQEQFLKRQRVDALKDGLEFVEKLRNKPT